MSPERVDSNESSLLKKATIYVVDVPEIERTKGFTFKRIEKLEFVTLILIIVLIFVNVTYKYETIWLVCIPFQDKEMSQHCQYSKKYFFMQDILDNSILKVHSDCNSYIIICKCTINWCINFKMHNMLNIVVLCA